MFASIQIKTPAHSSAVDITDAVAREIRESGASSGLCVVYAPHTTAGITINEGTDPDVMRDVLETLEKLVPWRAGYLHTEGNSAAHIKSIFTGGSVQVIIDSGRPVLGTWERIFLCEFDGPRTRKIHVKIMKD